ncbi:MAG: hypothetical protein ACRD2Q_08135 [Terriglobales bacterium]
MKPTHLKILLCVLCVLCGDFPVFGQEPELFTLVRSDLEVSLAPSRQELSARGKVVLRNDWEKPQRQAALQISSSLEWNSVRLAGRPLPMKTKQSDSDIDHTGSLSEVMVTLPQEVGPGGSVELEIKYAGRVIHDATRLTRMGTPKDVALRTDWDRISESFTAVRGVGYVVWYPIAKEIELQAYVLGEHLGGWKRRHADSSMRVKYVVDFPLSVSFTVVSNGKAVAGGGPGQNWVTYEFAPLGMESPTFVVAGYRALMRAVARVYHLPEHEEAAAEYARAAAGLQPMVAAWFGPPRRKFEVVELAEGGPMSTSRARAGTTLEVAPWESGAMLFTPLHTAKRDLLEVALVHQMTHASLASFRPWIEEGAAHFAQALQREQQQGRPAALEYMQRQVPPLAVTEQMMAMRGSDNPGNFEQPRPPSLITSDDEILYRTKAMFVWWMLRDMVGDAALQRALNAYKAEMDKSPAYVQSLVEKESGRRLEWFFDDWVYRGRGLPDFRITETKARANLDGSFTVDVTVENLGTASAEVPVTVRTEGARVTQRVLVIAGDSEDVRITVPAKPVDVVVNDGSVPESDMGNNRAEVLPES